MKIALCVPGSRQWSEYFICKDLEKYLKREGYQVDIIYDRKPTYQLIGYDRILFRIRYQRDYETKLFQEKLKEKSFLWVGGPDLFHRIEDWSIFSNLICQSEFMKRSLLENTNAEGGQVSIVPAGVDTETFYPKSDIERDISLGTCGNKKQPRKRYEKTINDFPNIYWHDGWNDERLPREEMANLFNRMETYLAYSDFEAGPMGLIEAGACGCQLVSTKVGYGLELESCENIPFDNPSEVETSFERRGREVLDEVKEKFAWKNIISDWEGAMSL